MVLLFLFNELVFCEVCSLQGVSEDKDLIFLLYNLEEIECNIIVVECYFYCLDMDLFVLRNKK